MASRQVTRVILMVMKTDTNNPEGERVSLRAMKAMEKGNRTNLSNKGAGLMEKGLNIEIETPEETTHLTISEEEEEVMMDEAEVVDARIISREEEQEEWKSVVQHFMMGQTSNQRKKS